MWYQNPTQICADVIAGRVRETTARSLSLDPDPYNSRKNPSSRKQTGWLVISVCVWCQAFANLDRGCFTWCFFTLGQLFTLSSFKVLRNADWLIPSLFPSVWSYWGPSQGLSWTWSPVLRVQFTSLLTSWTQLHRPGWQCMMWSVKNTPANRIFYTQHLSDWKKNRYCPCQFWTSKSKFPMMQQ